MTGFAFKKEDAQRIANTVRAVEKATSELTQLRRGFQNKEEAEDIVVEITGNVTGSQYTGKTKLFDIDTKSFVDYTAQRIWDGTNDLNSLYELSGSSTVSTGTIVTPFLDGGQDGNGYWFFDGGAAAVTKPFTVTFDTTLNQWTIVSEFSFNSPFETFTSTGLGFGSNTSKVFRQIATWKFDLPGSGNSIVKLLKRFPAYTSTGVDYGWLGTNTTVTDATTNSDEIYRFGKYYPKWNNA